MLNTSALEYLWEPDLAGSKNYIPARTLRVLKGSRSLVLEEFWGPRASLLEAQCLAGAWHKVTSSCNRKLHVILRMCVLPWKNSGPSFGSPLQHSPE